MLLFSDGFEEFNSYDIGRKWGLFEFYNPGGTQYAGKPEIVHGADMTFSPPKRYARSDEGRALQGRYFKLTTCIRPSRTVFVGFAHRVAVKYAGTTFHVVEIKFLKSHPYDKATRCVSTGDSYVPITTISYPFTENANPLVATCILRIYPSYIDVIWTFVGTTPLTQTGRINTSSVLDNGDFRYFQVGMTLMGNIVAQPLAWAEVRLGSRGGANNLLHSSIMTGPESGVSASFLINTVSIRVGAAIAGYSDATNTTYPTHGLDDVYICNDEGDYNNTFLGNVKVKRVSVSGDGTENNSVPFGESYRYRTVDEDFIDTVQSLPVPLPNHETNPLFIPWETFNNNYFTLEEYGDRQLMRFTSLPALGSFPKIHGAILHALMQPLRQDTPATLTAVRKLGFDLIESKPMDAPLITRTEFEARHFVWENEETINPGEQYSQWAATAVDASEWGFQLEPVTIDPITYDPVIIRVNLTFNETMNETIDFSELVHRYFEELIGESLVSADTPSYEWTWFFGDTFGFTEDSEGNRAGNRFLNETLEFSEYLPYTIIFVGEFLGLTEEIFVQHIDLIEETIDAVDWAFGARVREDATGDWDELTLDNVAISDASRLSWLVLLDETFGLEEPYLWDGHEDIEETIQINVTYVWDNHELMEEWLYPDDYAQNGVGLIAEDEIDMAEEHHDGWWVELFPDYTQLADSVLTQHWRYEIMFGFVVASWQVSPVEQTGNDGDHTGDNPWGS
jgi:hypothetical protein